MTHKYNAGDLVQWGDPAHPNIGQILSISQNGLIAYIKRTATLRGQYSHVTVMSAELTPIQPVGAPTEAKENTA